MNAPRPHIRPAGASESAACETILRALPGWFGIESSLMQYVADAARWPTWFAFANESTATAEPLGFITLHQHFPEAAEIHCLAVVPEHHRIGIGRALVTFSENWLRERGVRYLQVKTLGPSRPCPFYDRTRAFYAGVGFVPVEEFLDLWPGNPCLMMVKTLRSLDTFGRRG